MISPTQLSAIDSVEDLIHQDVGRNMFRAFNQTKGQLGNAAMSFAYASTENLHVGLMTGFFIEKARAAETDGPSSTAQMAFALSKLGINCRVITDIHCAQVVRAALDAADAKKVVLDVVTDAGQSLDEHIRKWKARPFSHLIATERPGSSMWDGKPYNMNGEVITQCVPFDRLFKNGDKKWITIGIGDGGNEIGMGQLPVELVANDIRNGRTIACATGSDHLITAGVSNWGLNGLMGAMAIVKPEWRAAFRQAMSPDREQRIIEAMVNAGAVDGITKKRVLTVDTLSMNDNLAKTRAILDVVEDAAARAPRRSPAPPANGSTPPQAAGLGS